MLIDNAFKFYGSYLDLKKEDKVNVLENELVRDYEMRMHLLEQEREWAVREHKTIEKSFDEMSELASQRAL